MLGIISRFGKGKGSKKGRLSFSSIQSAYLFKTLLVLHVTRMPGYSRWWP